MQQMQLNLDAPKASELFQYDSQNYSLYLRIAAGGITNAEIVKELGIFSYTRRISDLREKLHPRLFDIKAERIQKSLYRYTLVKILNQQAAA
jgi:hypothetical protein